MNESTQIPIILNQIAETILSQCLEFNMKTKGNCAELVLKKNLSSYYNSLTKPGANLTISKLFSHFCY